MIFTPTLRLEHTDSRGEIYSIELPNGHELMLLHSTPGAKRGGHSHDCDEVVMVLSGRIRYYKLDALREESPPDNISIYMEYMPGMLSFNQAGVIHMGEFPEDTWLIEYKLAKKGEWSQENFQPYRDKVEASLRRTSS